MWFLVASSFVLSTSDVCSCSRVSSDFRFTSYLGGVLGRHLYFDRGTMLDPQRSLMPTVRLLLGRGSITLGVRTVHILCRRGLGRSCPSFVVELIGVLPALRFMCLHARWGAVRIVVFSLPTQHLFRRVVFECFQCRYQRVTRSAMNGLDGWLRTMREQHEQEPGSREVCLDIRAGGFRVRMGSTENPLYFYMTIMLMYDRRDCVTFVFTRTQLETMSRESLGGVKFCCLE